MSPIFDQTQDIFEDGFDWPMRLLHVPSMTSYPWIPGNKYSDAVEPRYNVLSYTWGRWQLKDGERLDTSAIQVNGITWDLPRIDPEAHFTTDEFYSIIQHVQTGVNDRTDVEYIWLDVACIDQTKGSPEMAVEIGRQAQIFGQAEGCYVWLSKLDTQQLRDCFVELNTLKNTGHPDESWANEAIRLMQQILSDPWFTSLWTLQESWLQRDAVFLTKDAEPLFVDGIESKYLGLLDMVNISSLLLERMNAIDGGRKENHLSPTSSIYRLQQLISESGFHALGSWNPMALLTASNFRQVAQVRQNDRVYGIMQVFGFRLGISDPNERRGRNFTLNELEDQFGAALIRDYPLMSQLHVFGASVERGKKWHCSKNSTITKACAKFWWPASMKSSIPTTLALSTCIHKGTTWGSFSGVSIPFSELFGACQRLGPRSWYKDRWNKEGRRRQVLELDRDPILGQFGFSGADIDHTIYVSHEDAHIKQCKKLLSGVKDNCELRVLLMGYFLRWVQKRWAFGLLLLRRKHEEEWNRIGLFFWYFTGYEYPVVLTHDDVLLQGETQEWTQTEGIFGCLSGREIIHIIERGTLNWAHEVHCELQNTDMSLRTYRCTLSYFPYA